MDGIDNPVKKIDTPHTLILPSGSVLLHTVTRDERVGVVLKRRFSRTKRRFSLFNNDTVTCFKKVLARLAGPSYSFRWPSLSWLDAVKKE